MSESVEQAAPPEATVPMCPWCKDWYDQDVPGRIYDVKPSLTWYECESNHNHLFSVWTAS